MIGFIYIMSNPSHPDLVKIGQTSKDPEERRRELYTTGVPTDFVLEYWALSDDYVSLELEIHRSLDHLRFNQNKEFFNISVPEAINEIRERAGQRIESEKVFYVSPVELERIKEEKRKIEEDKRKKEEKEKRKTEKEIRKIEEKLTQLEEDKRKKEEKDKNDDLIRRVEVCVGELESKGYKVKWKRFSKSFVVLDDAKLFSSHWRNKLSFKNADVFLDWAEYAPLSNRKKNEKFGFSDFLLLVIIFVAFMFYKSNT